MVAHAYQGFDPGDVTQASIVTSAAFQQRRLLVKNECSDWNQRLEQKLNSLTSLPRDWDGYRAMPVKYSVAAFAAKILENLCMSDIPVPDLVPGRDGSLQIEWHYMNYDIEIDILAAQSVVACRFDKISGREEEVEISNDFAVVHTWLNEMRQRIVGAQKKTA